MAEKKEDIDFRPPPITDQALPLISSGLSMIPDMRLGWKPKEATTGAPIPLYYDYEPFEIPINPFTNKYYEPVYLGPRLKHSIEIHKLYANKKRFNGQPSYFYKWPTNMGMIEHIIRTTHRTEPMREFQGMNPKIKDFE